MNNLRRRKIESIINYLEVQAIESEIYNDAILENINFFNNAKSFFSFYKWLYKKANKIKPENLLELMDFDSFSPYATELISSLAATERKIFPALINPLVRKIVKLIINRNQSLIINIGCGAMEVERQIIARLIRAKNTKPVTFIGIDKSVHAHILAKQNLNKLKSKVDIIERENIDDDSLNEILTNVKGLYTVVLCKNDIFSFDKYFCNTSFDLAFNCFFKHHFDSNTSQEIDRLLFKFSKKIIEYDGINNNFNSFIQSVFVWKNPVLLNGTVFSNLRYIKKNELQPNSPNLHVNTFWRRGTYLKEMCFAPLK